MRAINISEEKLKEMLKQAHVDGQINASTGTEPNYIDSEDYVNKEINSEIDKLFENKDNAISESYQIYRVKQIADLMLYKLNKNKDKPCDMMNMDKAGRKWTHLKIDWLQMRLLEEFIELQKAILDNKPPIMIARECADICNFAMMIADNSGGLTGQLYEIKKILITQELAELFPNIYNTKQPLIWWLDNKLAKEDELIQVINR